MLAENEALMINALIFELLWVSRFTAPLLSMVESSIYELVLVRIRLVASAPAPLMRTLPPTANPAEMDAAEATALMVALPSANNPTSPVIVFT